MLKHSRACLIILDGWAIGNKPEADAIRQANTPFMDALWRTRPHCTLTTHGEAVGLPEGQMGNSEVGHLNIGAGRIVWQELARINKAIREGIFDTHPVLQEAFRVACSPGKRLHFLGLVSDGGVHAHIHHLKALCDAAYRHGVPQVFIHAFTDGRDCDPKSGAGFLQELQQYLKRQGYSDHIQIASVIGRYYAMDRDKRWERIQKAYNLLVYGQGEHANDLIAAVHNCYNQEVTDEFLPPLVGVNANGQPLATLKAGDVVIAFNFRTDRLRELTTVLTQRDMPEWNMHTLPLHYVTMTRYDEQFTGISVLFEKENLENTLGEVIANAGLTQLRIAETEKYPHVTFFFSGGREEPFPGEMRRLIPSPKVATYDLQPEMSAYPVTEAVIRDVLEKRPDFICLNYANPDMVGHTGVFAAAVKAVETVDTCLSRLVPILEENDYAVLITADHGNADYMINDDGSPNTAHTKNPVPCLLVSRSLRGVQLSLRNGILADIAPTLLQLLGLAQPQAMTGLTLLVNSSD
ncbi:MAG: 2,3-bisphosphoglycerate-independent phosphoglycerate mutase [Saprospiraceae bacterium]|nr:2,3-bisphosphoglycerate-independent phosphoglycerate mutase [Saprospiraceae bacterium]MDW8483591.1 2,3-bisphosphoglycerate-independent phosphoglycerate mutase [Saprospiraceae bacterium]